MLPLVSANANFEADDPTLDDLKRQLKDGEPLKSRAEALELPGERASEPRAIKVVLMGK